MKARAWSLAKIAAGFACAAALGSAAQAHCPAPYQEDLSDYDSTLLRNVLLDARDEIEGFFDLELDAVCIDYEPETAYYTHQPPDYDAIVIGEDFLFEMTDAPWNINSLVSILAHEAGHAFQVKWNLLGALSYTETGFVECLELHADFLAGGFMRSTAGKHQVDMQHISELFYTLGDHDYTSNTHHGTPADRFLAFKNGYSAPAGDEKLLGAMGMAYVSRTNCIEN